MRDGRWGHKGCRMHAMPGEGRSKQATGSGSCPMHLQCVAHALVLHCQQDRACKTAGQGEALEPGVAHDAPHAELEAQPVPPQPARGAHPCGWQAGRMGQWHGPVYDEVRACARKKKENMRKAQGADWACSCMSAARLSRMALPEKRVTHLARAPAPAGSWPGPGQTQER